MLLSRSVGFLTRSKPRAGNTHTQKQEEHHQSQHNTPSHSYCTVTVNSTQLIHSFIHSRTRIILPYNREFINFVIIHCSSKTLQQVTPSVTFLFLTNTDSYYLLLLLQRGIDLTPKKKNAHLNQESSSSTKEQGQAESFQSIDFLQTVVIVHCPYFFFLQPEPADSINNHLDSIQSNPFHFPGLDRTAIDLLF